MLKITWFLFAMYISVMTLTMVKAAPLKSDKEQTERDSLLKELNDVTNSKILEKLIQQAMYNSTSMKELESGLLKIRQKGGADHQSIIAEGSSMDTLHIERNEKELKAKVNEGKGAEETITTKGTKVHENEKKLENEEKDVETNMSNSIDVKGHNNSKENHMTEEDEKSKIQEEENEGQETANDGLHQGSDKAIETHIAEENKKNKEDGKEPETHSVNKNGLNDPEITKESRITDEDEKGKHEGKNLEGHEVDGNDLVDRFDGSFIVNKHKNKKELDILQEDEQHEPDEKETGEDLIQAAKEETEGKETTKICLVPDCLVPDTEKEHQEKGKYMTTKSGQDNIEGATVKSSDATGLATIKSKSSKPTNQGITETETAKAMDKTGTSQGKLEFTKPTDQDLAEIATAQTTNGMLRSSRRMNSESTTGNALAGIASTKSADKKSLDLAVLDEVKSNDEGSQEFAEVEAVQDSIKRITVKSTDKTGQSFSKMVSPSSTDEMGTVQSSEKMGKGFTEMVTTNTSDSTGQDFAEIATFESTNETGGNFTKNYPVKGKDVTEAVIVDSSDETGQDFAERATVAAIDETSTTFYFTHDYFTDYATTNDETIPYSTYETGQDSTKKHTTKSTDATGQELATMTTFKLTDDLGEGANETDEE